MVHLLLLTASIITALTTAPPVPAPWPPATIEIPVNPHNPTPEFCLCSRATADAQGFDVICMLTCWYSPPLRDPVCAEFCNDLEPTPCEPERCLLWKRGQGVDDWWLIQEVGYDRQPDADIN